MKVRIQRNLSSSKKKTLNDEMRKSLIEWDRKHETEIDAIILWALHREFGFGKERLKRAYKVISEEFASLRRRYELDDDMAIWLCTEKVKELGIDLEEMKDETQSGSHRNN